MFELVHVGSSLLHLHYGYSRARQWNNKMLSKINIVIKKYTEPKLHNSKDVENRLRGHSNKK